MTITKHISPLIASQFPLIYQQEGQGFVEFVKAYFEWMEEYGPLADSRSLLSYRDVDSTLDSFLSNFIEKYMTGLPVDVVGDKRMLQKHITEVFASKGSPRGLQLLFRLLYNVDSNVYFPGDDVLRASDGEWKIPTYLEVTDNGFNSFFSGEDVVGAQSGAKAIVESYERRTVKGRLVNIMYLSNIRGNFINGERLLTSLVEPEHCPIITGPLTHIDIDLSALDYSVGDVLRVVTDSGEGGRAVVTETGVRAGTVDFTLVNGGSGYSLPFTQINVTGDNGVGADFEIELANTSPFVVSDLVINAYSSVLLNASNYAMNPSFGTTNVNSLLNDAFATYTIQVGTISRLVHINPGEGYTGNIVISVRDAMMAGYHLDDGNGGEQGNNAVVTGRAQFGAGVIETVKVIDSGFGYRDGTEVELQSDQRPEVATGTVRTRSQGSQEGYWVSTRGFLNSDKYLHDSYYYQEYSYDVRSSIALNKYADLLRRIWHPAGTEMFGSVVISSEVSSNNEVISSITQA